MEYASKYVIRIAGASQRQLQLWDEQSLVSHVMPDTTASIPPTK
jgi:hypothetical protein